MKRIMFAVLALAGCLVAACATINPFAAAKGPDEKAYAVLGTYQVAQRQILKIVNDTTVSTSLRQAAANADAAAVGVLRSLNQALDKYLDARDALAAGATTKDKVAIAIANLNDWVIQAQAAVADVQKALAAAKKKPVRSSSTWTPLNRLNFGSA